MTSSQCQLTSDGRNWLCRMILFCHWKWKTVLLVERGLAEYLEEEVGLAEEKVNNSENEKEEEGCNTTLSESFVLLQ